MNKLYDQYKEQVAFYVVYIQEAHSSDLWQVPSNLNDGVLIASPRNFEERGEVAGSCIRKLGIKIPAVLDDFQNSTEVAYTGWPDRLYVIDRDGRVAHKSQAGPYGFHPQDVAAALQRIVPPQTQTTSLGGQ
ncbi:MAG: deiodinase [Acidobacteria bacterium]|nr:deiodinase [Acidobacteriota bacterium]